MTRSAPRWRYRKAHRRGAHLATAFILMRGGTTPARDQRRIAPPPLPPYHACLSFIRRDAFPGPPPAGGVRPRSPPMPDDARPVDVHTPAVLAERLGGPGPGLDRRALEALAVAAYQAGDLT